MNWPTREYAQQAAEGRAERNAMLYLKACYVLAGGDRQKVREAIEQAAEVRLKDVRGVAPKEPS